MFNYDFYFTRADANANREGRLTAQQESLVESIYQFRQRGARQTVIAFIVLFVVMMVTGAGIELSKWEGTLTDFVREMSPIFLMMAGIFAAMLTISAISGVLVAQDAKNRRISVAEGKARIFSGLIYGRYMRHQLVLSRGFFRRAIFRFGSEKPLWQFETGKHYRVYYIKFYPLPIILSAEEIT
jgi:ABC-type uncharacterized transport system fused permease/ATPase subunit